MRMHGSKRHWINLLAHNFKFICYFQKIVHSVTTEGKTIAHAPDTMARFPDMAQYSVSRLWLLRHS